MAFIGRERELAVLGAALQRSSQRELTRVAITGPLGIGTTRLLDELETRITKASDLAQVVVCRARCLEPEVGVAYAGLRMALGVEFDAATQAMPALDAPDQRGARVREGLLRLLEAKAAQGQLCLIVEDLEHADPGTRELVRMLLRLRRRVALTLIVAYHPDEIGRGHPAAALRDEIDAHADVERVPLEPLAAEDLLALVEALTGERPTLSFMAAVMEGSGGNPLVASQLVEANQRHAGIRLSDPLEEIIHARLAQLERPTLRAVRLLAAARRPMAIDQLARIRLPDGHLARSALTELEESGLAITDVGGGPAGALGIHQLVAEAIDHSTLPIELHALHAALAEANADVPAVAAWHWARALQPARARDAYLAAAALAEEIGPGPTSLADYSAALELDLDGQVDAETIARAAASAYAAGAFRHAATLAEQAIERLAGGRAERLLTSRAVPQARDRAALLSEELGRYRRSSGDSVGGRAAIEQALELAAGAPAATRAHVLASLAQDLMLEGRFEDSAARAEEARQAAVGAGEDGLADLAHATDTLAVDLGFGRGEIDRALALLDEALDAARRAGRLDELMRCYANKTTLLDLDSRREEALAVVKEGIAEAVRGGLPLTYGAFLRGNAADILFQLGRWAESEAECRAALEFPPAGVAWFSPILYLGLVLVESRADEEAARLVGQTLLEVEAVPAGQWSALVTRSAVSLALWRGEVADAVAAAESGWERVLETDDPLQLASAAATVLEACAAAAERGRARRDYSAVADAGALAARVLPVAAEQLARHRLADSVGARREAELYLATARAHDERVRGRARPEPWAKLAQAWAALHIPYNVARARWWQTQALLPDRSRRNEARRALIEAWKIAGKLPAAPLRKQLAELGVRGNIRLPEDRLVAIPIVAEVGARDLVAVGPGPGSNVSAPGLAARIGTGQRTPQSGRFGLSPRESSVLVVLTEGRTNREIAERLFISERTVAVHVRRILSKLGVKGRVEAAGVAIRLGLVPDDPRAIGARSSRR
jgi:DNA-binding CsgD family transcriptional regulator/tetratricopeptide (TPR) repeat protein